MAVKAAKVKRERKREQKAEGKKSNRQLFSSASRLPSPSALLRWYDKNRRIMPWRALPGQSADPYRVWLSEVMLQQTTVVTVVPYFQKFIQRWPTLKDLAAADLDDVMRLWAGLGYYRRARMLHQCALTVCDKYNGVFPSDEKSLLALSGFGAYTAAAVRAIAFGQSANVVDGNVERVMARIFAVTDPMPKSKAKLREAAATLVPQKRCGDYAQALMDLGATICTPRSPKCGLCPWQNNCAAFAKGIQETLPRRIKAKAKPVRRAVAFVLLNPKGEVFIRQRPPQGLLGGMMEVPSSPWLEQEMPSLKDAKKHAPKDAKWQLCTGTVIHVFTHFTFEISVAVARAPSGKGHYVAPDNIKNEALPSVMKKIIHHALKSL